MTTSRFAPRVLLLAAFMALSLALFAACDDGDDAAPGGNDKKTVTVTHNGGTDTVPLKPGKVVVFDLGVFLSLHRLGITADAVSLTSAPVPSEYKDAVAAANQAIGTPFEPDYEAVNALEPDLIIVAGRSAATLPEMKKIAPTIDLTIDESDYLDSFHQRHEVLGQVFGVEDKVAAELKKLDDAIAEVAKAGPQAGKALIVMTNGPEVSAYGPGSRFGLVHNVFGFGAADESLERDATHGDVVSFEFILNAAPDVLFVIDRASTLNQDGEAAKKVLDNQLVAQTPAWKNGRVVYTDGFAWYLAPNTFSSMERIIADVRAGLPQ